MSVGKPKRDGSGKGRRANRGRGEEVLRNRKGVCGAVNTIPTRVEFPHHPPNMVM